ncbi:MAG: HD domain-containing protein [Firmicutes bacterium]|nr:HD domain-containing protein [Bacillota bacterium]MDH7496179.1 HD domain-containing protein [Bacillota bacterium]
MDKEEIMRLTEEYGGKYGLNHSKRILHIVSLIAGDQEYDRDVVWTSAFLHDWGSYSPWKVDGIDHAMRSKQVAEGFLTKAGCDEGFIGRVLECIELHHSGTPDKSIEAKLLSDADAIDYLGVVGVLRDFSTKPRDLRKAYESVESRKERLKSILFFEESKAMAAERIRRAERILSEFVEESFGCF